MGPDAQIMIDAGVVWGTDYETAYNRAEAFAEFSPTWLEEPLAPDAIDAYGALTEKNPSVPYRSRRRFKYLSHGGGPYRKRRHTVCAD